MSYSLPTCVAKLDGIARMHVAIRAHTKLGYDGPCKLQATGDVRLNKINIP
jgi:hypothetical protein